MNGSSVPKFEFQLKKVLLFLPILLELVIFTRDFLACISENRDFKSTMSKQHFSVVIPILNSTNEQVMPINRHLRLTRG